MQRHRKTFYLLTYSATTLTGFYVMWEDVCQFSGDVREVQFLYQRISVVVQLFNAVLLHDSLLVDEQPE